MPESANRFPFEVHEFPGTEALTALDALRRQGAGLGFAAVLLGGADGLRSHEDQLADDSQSSNDILEQAASIDVSQWFAERARSDPHQYRVEPGAWPGKLSPNVAMRAYMNASGHPQNKVFIAKIPTKKSWEVAAYLKFGGWNDCPPPECQVAVSKYWHDLYAAEIAAVTEDTVEYLVARPPQDRTSVEKLAREHFIFCSDIVHQGVGTMSNLAAMLMNGRVWYFWWD